MAGNAPPTSSFNCPACDLPVPVRGLGRAPIVVCAACGTIIDTADSRLRIVQRFQEELLKPLLPLGKRGKIRGTEYEIIGFMVRCDSSGMYAWEEYLLINPYKGFAWLVQAEGHWNFLVGIKDDPSGGGTPATLHYKGRPYKKFMDDTPRVVSVVGEFYWEVSTGDQVESSDYIHPPYLLSREESRGEVVWSHGAYIPKRELERALSLKASLPSPTGIAMNQPNPWKQRAIYCSLVGLVFTVLVVLLHGVLGNTESKIVMQHSFLFDPASPASQKITSDEFTISGRTTNLRVDVKAPVQNSWIDLDLELVNLDSGVRDENQAEVAYYFGSDSDGSWTEGGQAGETYFASLTPGRYALAAEISSGSPQLAIPFTITAEQGVPTSGNVVLGIIAILLVPIICALGGAMFENARWNQSSTQ